MPSSDYEPAHRDRIRQLERANHELVLHELISRALLDELVKLLATAIEERNHWYRKANDGFTNRD